MAMQDNKQSDQQGYQQDDQQINNQNNQVIDLGMINNLKEIGDKSFVNEIIDLYLDQAPVLINEMKNSFTENNRELLSRSAHTLKGASLNIGANYTAEICKRIEYDTNENINEDIQVLLNELDSAYEQTSGELLKIKDKE